MIDTTQALVSTDWLLDRLEQPDLRVVDASWYMPDQNRNPRAEYAAEHIPGAVFFDIDEICDLDNPLPHMLPPPEKVGKLIGSLGIDNQTHVVLVPEGRNAADIGTATRVYWTFKVLGHDAVSVLDGGWRAWTADASNPVAAGAVTPKPAVFTAKFRDALFASTAEVETARKQSVPLVDARPNEQYIGKTKSPVAKAFGTIPAAVNVENTSFYDDKAGKFISKAEIAALLDKAGVKKDGDIVAFCNTGHWASVAWFGISEVYGNQKTTLYDGSMAEWTMDSARPVERKFTP